MLNGLLKKKKRENAGIILQFLHNNFVKKKVLLGINKFP